jgi:diguanylate cyclase (GGDEF)-like protein/hemerythrin-like metal-binding protein
MPAEKTPNRAFQQAANPQAAGPFEPDLRRLPLPEERELFARFPLALALVGRDGSLRFNDRYRDCFDTAGADDGVFRRLLETPGPGWRDLKLRGRDGGEIAVHVQAVALASVTLILLADDTAVARDAELDHLRRRIDELEKVSATDFLTGAWNRAHLERVLHSELARSLRFRQPLSALLIDVDHFKSINDSLGHQAGDAVLCEMVQLIQRKIRGADLLFRWGGEEFVVLAVSTRYRDAHTLAEHLRERVGNHVFPHGKTVTASIGVAEHNGSENAQAWFSRLDAALFVAKNGGRNRVITDPRGNSDLWANGAAPAVNLAWRDSNACGNAQIDAEHRQLVELANRLSAAESAPPAAYEAAVSALIDALTDHFAAEERMLEAGGYPGLAEHRRTHAALLAKAAALRASGGSLAAGEARRPLIEFLVNEVVARHLFGTDREYFGSLPGSRPGR